MRKKIAGKICAILTGISLAVIPAVTLAAYAPAPSGRPPIEQTLVREGTLAVKLAALLQLGNTDNELQAETWLGDRGISPKNGWIADYPVTPDITGELSTALVDAADAKQIPFSRDDALQQFDNLVAQLGIAVSPDESAGNPPASSDETAVPADDLYDYYIDEGPPVVTYYAPPLDYYYLYSWVPYPFWCDGFWFGGFFILNDFDRPVFFGHGHHRHFVTNHFRNIATNQLARVNPVTRSVSTAFSGVGARTRNLAATAGVGTRHDNSFIARTRQSASGRAAPAPTIGREGGGVRRTPLTGYATQAGVSRAYGTTPGYTAHYRGYSPPPGSAVRYHSYNAPATRSFGSYRSYASPARSFAPRSSFRSFAPRSNFSTPSFSRGPSFSHSFSAAPSFRGGGFASRGGRR